MSPKPLASEHPAIRYSIAIAVTGLVSAFIVALRPLWEPEPSPPFLLAVLLVAWKLGFGPAVTTCLGSVVVIHHFFLPPAVFPPNWNSVAGVLSFTTVALIIAWLAARRGKVETAIRASDATIRARAAKAEAGRREAELIAGVSHTMNASLNIDAVLQAVANAAQELVACELTRIALWDETREVMTYRYTVGTRYPGYAAMRLTPGKGLVGAAIATGEPVRSEDVFDDPRATPDYFGVARTEGIISAMVVPIHVRARIEGLLYFAHRQRRPFTDEDQRIAMRLADRAGVALQNAELYRAEQRARAEAEEANRSKDRFLAMLSHELRTPLNAVMGWARMLRNPRLGAPERSQAAEVIERNTRLQAQLINDLLDVSRIIADKLDLERFPVDVVTIVREAIETIRTDIEAKHIQLTNTLDPSSVDVLADPLRLQQVVSNLLSNAVKFTGEGGRIDVKLSVANTTASLAVVDTGEGIDPAVLPHIFEAFHQADTSTTRTHQGLGLGLAIVRHLVQRHGGTVRAESAGRGHGATFTVELPIVVARIARTSAGGAERIGDGDFPVRLNGIRVLVVDDQKDARELNAAVLREGGADVYVAGSVAETLDLLKRTAVDVLGSDLAMPGADGYELIRRVRLLEHGRNVSVPAIALTAYASAEDRRRTLAATF